MWPVSVFAYVQDEEKVLKTLNMSHGGGWLIRNYSKKENGAAAAKNGVCTGRSEGVKVLWVGEAKGRGREKNWQATDGALHQFNSEQ